jgi:hypothetical protein
MCAPRYGNDYANWFFESVGGPHPPLNPADLLCENVWRGELAGFLGFQFAHARVLAGEQLPQKTTNRIL